MTPPLYSPLNIPNRGTLRQTQLRPRGSARQTLKPLSDCREGSHYRFQALLLQVHRQGRQSRSTYNTMGSTLCRCHELRCWCHLHRIHAGVRLGCDACICLISCTVLRQTQCPQKAAREPFSACESTVGVRNPSWAGLAWLDGKNYNPANYTYQIVKNRCGDRIC